jgi:hypothetical protein
MGKPWENGDLMVVQWDLMVVQWCLNGDLMVHPSYVGWFSFTPGILVRYIYHIYHKPELIQPQTCLATERELDWGPHPAGK